MRVKTVVLVMLAIVILLPACASPCTNDNAPADTVISGSWVPIHQYESGLGWFPGSLFFVDDTHGWKVGATGHILSTSDGGYTWTQQDSGTTNSLRLVWFIDRNRGWAAGENNTLLMTTDGGSNWVVQELEGDPQGHIASMYFVDEQNGWIMGSDGILQTEDSGATWSFISTTSGLRAPSFWDRYNGWAIGDAGLFDALLHTTDGGVTWTSCNQDLGDLFITDVLFTDSQSGWLGRGGAPWDSSPRKTTPLYRSTDGGKTWLVHQELPLSAVDDIQFADENLGWIAGNGILFTTDGGESWTSQLCEGLEETIDGWGSFSSLSVVDSHHAWAIFADGTLYRFVPITSAP